MSRSIVKPILMLSDEARRISMNDYSGDDIIIKGDDEISLLIKEFTEMKHSTKNYIVTLKENIKLNSSLSICVLKCSKTRLIHIFFLIH